MKSSKFRKVVCILLLLFISYCSIELVISFMSQYPNYTLINIRITEIILFTNTIMLFVIYDTYEMQKVILDLLTRFVLRDIKKGLKDVNSICDDIEKELNSTVSRQQVIKENINNYKKDVDKKLDK